MHETNAKPRGDGQRLREHEDDLTRQTRRLAAGIDPPSSRHGGVARENLGKEAVDARAAAGRVVGRYLLELERTVGGARDIRVGFEPVQLKVAVHVASRTVFRECSIGQRLEADSRHARRAGRGFHGVNRLARIRSRSDHRPLRPRRQRDVAGCRERRRRQHGPMHRRLAPHRFFPQRLSAGEPGRRLVQLLVEPINLGLNRFSLRFLLGRGYIHYVLDELRPIVERAHLVVGVGEEGHHPVVVPLAERVVLVIVALRACERGAQPHRGCRIHAIDEQLVPGLVRIDAAFLVRHRIAMKAARNQLVARRTGQHVARDLIDREAVERHVAVERVNHPVAVLPHDARSIFLEALGVGVARGVEPGPRPSLAIMRRGQQAIDEARVRGIAAVTPGLGDDRVHFVW